MLIQVNRTLIDLSLGVDGILTFRNTWERWWSIKTNIVIYWS